MISKLSYGPDSVHIYLAARVSSATSAPEYAYMIAKFNSEFDSFFLEQAEYFFPGFNQAGEATVGWFSSEEEARKATIEKVVEVFNEFNTWPQYRDHGYVPGEEYTGSEAPVPPGMDPFAESDKDM